jgi:PEGA domain
MNALLALALLALFILVACSTRSGRLTHRAVAQHAAPTVAAPVALATTRQVEILSEPPGARIEVNHNYIGEAPITTTFQCSLDGRFLETTIIRALPTRPGGYVQSKLFFVARPLYSPLGGYSADSTHDTSADLFLTCASVRPVLTLM